MPGATKDAAAKERGTAASMITLHAIDENSKELFRQLFNLYHHDLALLDPSLFPAIDDKGFYDYTAIEEYFNPEIRDKIFLYLIRCDDGIAGFCVISQAPYVKTGCDYCIQEFFITGNRRRQGLGREACQTLFTRHQGRYSLYVIEENITAQTFWTKLIGEVGREIVMEKDRTVFTFTV